MKIDGYARVITDSEGNIIYVIDNHFDNCNLNSNFGSTEIIDSICDLTSKDAEVLIPITYHYSESKYSNGAYSDPEEILNVQGEFVLCENFKQSMKDRIEKYKLTDAETIQIVNEHDFYSTFSDKLGSQVADEIEFFEEIYKEKYDSQ